MCSGAGASSSCSLSLPCRRLARSRDNFSTSSSSCSRWPRCRWPVLGEGEGGGDGGGDGGGEGGGDGGGEGGGVCTRSVCEAASLVLDTLQAVVDDVTVGEAGAAGGGRWEWMALWAGGELGGRCAAGVAIGEREDVGLGVELVVLGGDGDDVGDRDSDTDSESLSALQHESESLAAVVGGTAMAGTAVWVGLDAGGLSGGLLSSGDSLWRSPETGLGGITMRTTSRAACWPWPWPWGWCWGWGRGGACGCAALWLVSVTPPVVPVGTCPAGTCPDGCVCL